MSHGSKTSTGHAASSAEWLDLHFEANRAEYEAALRLAGLQPGWHVLDAACGAGNYLPWIVEDVGPGGQITALDLAPENIAIVEQRLAQNWSFSIPVEPVEGSVLDLPFSDGTFDAVWFANTSQYLPDDEFQQALAEFRRVLKPGGLLAVKDMDIGMWAIYPGPPDVFWGLFQHLLSTDGWNQIKGLASRVWVMEGWLRRAGFEGVWQRSLPIEYRPPLSEAKRLCLEETLADFSELVTRLIENGDIAVADEVRSFWELAGNIDHPDHPLRSPDFYRRDGQVVAVGRAPIG